jgi:hypothetical protein
MEPLAGELSASGGEGHAMALALGFNVTQRMELIRADGSPS